MDSKRDKSLILMFLVFIVLIFALFVVLPKNKVSENEKRNLSTAPEFSFKTVLNGSFEKDTETYLSDHFPFRNSFIALNSYFNLYTGRNGVNGIYKGRDGYLLNTPPKKTNLNRNIEIIKEFTDNLSMPVRIVIIPPAGEILENKLPKNHLEYSLLNELSDLKKYYKNNDRVNIFIPDNIFKNSSEQVYYKTDHHWTSQGAYETYKALIDEAFDKSQFKIEKYDGFYGTTYSKGAFWGEPSECIELFTIPSNVSVTIQNGDKTDVYNDMLFREHLETFDKYRVFLDGNNEFTRIENKDLEDKKLLIIKDSYANTLAPFLSLHYNTIDMIDLRHYTDEVTELIKTEKYDEILLVYGVSTLAETTDINMLY